MIYCNFFKRLFDFLAAGMALIVLSPVLFTLAICLYFQNHGKPIFFQERPGINARPFKIIKFRSMTDARDSNGTLLPDMQRINKIGTFIRKTSLDELPQLINVLKGDMSLVGPRPLLFKYIPRYSEEQFRRHNVRPGITGWAQVNGRNSICWSDKFRLDIYYVDNISLSLDIKILWMTFLKVIKKEGVNQSSEAPMIPFNGNN